MTGEVDMLVLALIVRLELSEFDVTYGWLCNWLYNEPRSWERRLRMNDTRRRVAPLIALEYVERSMPEGVYVLHATGKGLGLVGGSARVCKPEYDPLYKLRKQRAAT